MDILLLFTYNKYFTMNYLPEVSIDNIISFFSINEILSLKILSKENHTIIYNYLKRIHNAKHDEYRKFTSIINNISIPNNTWSQWCGISSHIQLHEYSIFKWDLLFSQKQQKYHFDAISYAIYYAYFMINNTAYAARTEIGKCVWSALIYENGMIKQLENTCGYLQYNNTDLNCKIITISYKYTDYKNWAMPDIKNNNIDINLTINFTEISTGQMFNADENIPIDKEVLKNIIWTNKKYNLNKKITYIEDFIQLSPNLNTIIY